MKWSGIFDRVDVVSLLNQHMSTFYHYEKKKFYNETKVPASDKIIFLLLPFLIAVFLCIAGLSFSKDYVDIILTSLSIFVGLLFTLMTMVLGLVQENAKIDLEKLPPIEKKITIARIDLTKHLFINIAFSVVLSIVSIMLVLLTQFHPTRIINYISDKWYYDCLRDGYLYFTNGLSFLFLIEFLLTLLMIVRRFAVLFINTVEK